MELVAIGDINLDTIITVPRLPKPDEEVEILDLREVPGGDAANVAVAFARLGGEAGMIGAVGNDSAGELLRAHLSTSGVDVTRVLITQGPSGHAFSLVEPNGIRRLLYIRGANSLRKLTYEDLIYVKKSKWFYVADPLPQTIEVLKAWYENYEDLPQLALDPGSAGASRKEGFFAPLFPYLSALLLNEGEAMTLTDQDSLEGAVEHLKQICPLVVVKRGDKGAFVATSKEEFSLPAYPIQAVDTTGCGDAFNAAFLFCLVRGRSPREAAQWGNAAGALAAQKMGAYAPCLEELEEFMLRFKEVV
ncbi:hypothetical protein H5T57_03480 [Candidatus Bipolaricaulota bacterium]|nr:hypothetical protein [Candidatus Bipolaricaulota bacterium]